MRLPRKWAALVLGVIVIGGGIIGVSFLVSGDGDSAVPTKVSTNSLLSPDSLLAQLQATPTPSPSPTLTPSPTSTPEPLQEPSPTVAEFVSPLETHQPAPLPQPTHSTQPAPSATPKPTPKPVPTPTPTPTPRLSYWVICAGGCYVIAPSIMCISYDHVGFTFKRACASPGFPPLCDLRLPATCEPAPPGWIVYCTGSAFALDNCDHSLDGSFSCSYGDYSTFCFPLPNACDPWEQTDKGAVTTCTRYDSGAEATCLKTSSDNGYDFACDSPTTGPFTCRSMPDHVFTC